MIMLCAIISIRSSKNPKVPICILYPAIHPSMAMLTSLCSVCVYIKEAAIYFLDIVLLHGKMSYYA